MINSNATTIISQMLLLRGANASAGMCWLYMLISYVMPSPLPLRRVCCYNKLEFLFVRYDIFILSLQNVLSVFQNFKSSI